MESRGAVLLVDDEEAVRLFEHRRIGSLGYACVSAADSAEGLALLEEHEVDCVVADIHMPGNENLAFVRAVEQLRPGLPVILVTGQPTVATAAAAVGLGVRAYLFKPYDTELLSAELQAAVGVRRLQQTLVKARRELDEVSERVARAEALLSSANSPDAAHDAYLKTMLWHVVSATAELCQSYAERSALPNDELPGSVEPPVSLQDLIGALRETVTVLDRTKNHFKSKDLGQLRGQLEGLLSKMGRFD